MASRKTINRLTGSLLIPIALTIPVLRLACDGGNPSPTIGAPIYRDISTRVPESVRYGVWGASGYVEAEAGCGSSETDDTLILATTGPIWFNGGGDAFNPGYELTLECPWYAVYMFTSTAWSWG